ncbi:MAG TPA: hypothetical protein VFY79_03855, partial [Dehalococcoidia bacterium]|nr:hypothetical protein [Dehalococcoidia bacterium]
EEIRKLRTDLDKLLEENRTLKDRLDKLEAGSNGAKPKAAPRRRGTAASTTPAKRPAAPRRAAASRTTSRNGARPAARGARRGTPRR